jgi:signal peptide peptidase SppA
MNRLAAYQYSVWLAEPQQLQRIVAKVLSFKECYSAREVAKYRREMLDLAAHLPNEAIAGAGFDLDIAAGVKAIRAVGQGKKIGVIPVYGPVDQHESSELMKAGGTSIDFISAALDAMLTKADIGAIVMHMNSPGGNVYGVEELSDKIYDARGTKPIYAMADSLAASAGYWIASACSMVIATTGADVGSVGVYVMHYDESAAMEKEGVKVSMISAGEHKTEFSPFGALSDGARAEAQRRVDSTYARFTGALKRNRNTSVEDVRDNYGKGRTVSADRALAAGMVDRVMSFETLISKLAGGNAAKMARGPSAEVMKLKNEWHKRRRAI